MGETTGIAWTDSSWNPLRGCSKVSAGCTNCYAEREANRSSGPGRAYEGLVKDGRWTGKVRLVEEHLEDPVRWQKPRRVFVNSMSDLFHESVSDEDIARIFAVMWRCYPRHQFQVLTKRPERMRDLLSRMETGRVTKFGRHAGTCLPDIPWLHQRAWQLANAVEPSRFYSKVSDWPLPNVWLGVSVEDQATADERIPLLLETPAAVRFVSAEPLLGELNLRAWFNPHADFVTRCGPKCRWLDWVIVGGESGPGARPCEPGWIGNIVDQCREDRVACFVKQMGTWHAARSRDIGYKHPKGGDPAEWAEHLRVQEYPA